MKHFAILFVQPPVAATPSAFDMTPEKTAQEHWQGFLHKVRVSGMPQNSQETWQLAEGLWQIPLASGLPFLGQAVMLCDQYKCSYRVLFLDEMPEWAVGGNSTTPAGGKP